MLGLTTITLGTLASKVTGTHFTGSKGSFGYKFWLIAIGPGGEASSVRPSGFARNTASAPMLPPAPGRLSTMAPPGNASCSLSAQPASGESAVATSDSAFHRYATSVASARAF